MEYINNILNYMSPYVRRAWDGKLPSDWQLEERMIFDFEIVYIMEGRASIKIEQTEYIGEPGDMFFFRPFKHHSMKSLGGAGLRQPHVHFDFFYQEDSERVYVPVWKFTDYGDDVRFLRDDISGAGFLNIPDKISLRNPDQLENLLFKVIKLEEMSSPGSILRKKSAILELLAYVIEEVEHIGHEKSELNASSINIDRLELTRNFIYENANRNLTLDEMSMVAGFSKNHFTRLFREQFGISPVQFHNNLRIERAKQMLGFSDNSITEIATMLGYNNIHTFSRAFKQNVLCTPSEYREKALK